MRQISHPRVVVLTRFDVCEADLDSILKFMISLYIKSQVFDNSKSVDHRESNRLVQNIKKKSNSLNFSPDSTVHIMYI